MNNLPPGCNSDDGGIDHEYESALERFADVVPNARIILLLTELAPYIEAIYGAAFNEGAEDARMFTDEDQTI